MVDEHPSIGLIAASIRAELKLAGVWGTTCLTKYLGGVRFEVPAFRIEIPVFRIEFPVTLSEQATNQRLKLLLICPPLESLYELLARGTFGPDEAHNVSDRGIFSQRDSARRELLHSSKGHGQQRALLHNEGKPRGLYRGTSLIRKRPLPGTEIGP